MSILNANHTNVNTAKNGEKNKQKTERKTNRGVVGVGFKGRYKTEQ